MCQLGLLCGRITWSYVTTASLACRFPAHDIHSFIHLFYKHSLSNYYLPNSALAAKDMQ